MAKEKHQCAGEVQSGFAFRAARCSRTGKIEENGKHWCSIHAPSKVAARKAATNEGRDRRMEHYRAGIAVNEARAVLVKAALDAVDLAQLDASNNALYHAAEAYRAAVKRHWDTKPD